MLNSNENRALAIVNQIHEFEEKMVDEENEENFNAWINIIELKLNELYGELESDLKKNNHAVINQIFENEVERIISDSKNSKSVINLDYVLESSQILQFFISKNATLNTQLNDIVQAKIDFSSPVLGTHIDPNKENERAKKGQGKSRPKKIKHADIVGNQGFLIKENESSLLLDFFSKFPQISEIPQGMTLDEVLNNLKKKHQTNKLYIKILELEKAKLPPEALNRSFDKTIIKDGNQNIYTGSTLKLGVIH